MPIIDDDVPAVVSAGVTTNTMIFSCAAVPSDSAGVPLEYRHKFEI